MVIKTKRLILRPWEESDAESLYKYAKEPDVGPVAGWPVHTSVENSLEIIKNVLCVDETYAVCLKEDNIAIGSIGLIPPAQSHTECGENEMEIGYWIGKSFWGNGYIPEVVRALQKHAFEDLGCTVLWCGYYDGNEKSKRCQEKCGFIYHHTEENKPCPLMGDIRTEHFTYLTKERWMNKQEKNMKTAIIYYSMHGNTAYVAKKLSEKLEADIIRITPVKAFPDKGFRKFIWGGKSAVMAEKPKLNPYEFNAEKYEQVIIGFPVWASRIAPPIRTFVEDNKTAISGKAVSAYACQAGSGAEKALNGLKELLGVSRYKATMILIDPKNKPNEENENKIDEFYSAVK